MIKIADKLSQALWFGIWVITYAFSSLTRSRKEK